MNNRKCSDGGDCGIGGYCPECPLVKPTKRTCLKIKPKPKPKVHDFRTPSKRINTLEEAFNRVEQNAQVEARNSQNYETKIRLK